MALVLPVLLASNVLATPSTSLNQSLSLAAALLSPTLTVIGGDRGRRGALIAAAVGAAVYCYVDLMLVAAVPWMLSAAGATAACFMSSGRRGRRVATRHRSGGGLACGLRVHVAEPVDLRHTIPRVESRHVGHPIPDRVPARRLVHVGPAGSGRSTTVNFEYWTTRISTVWAVLFLAAAVVVVAVVVASRRFGPARVAVFALLAWPAGLPVLWYEVVRNHSQIHPGKAHVSIPFALGVVVAAAVLAASSTVLCRARLLRMTSRPSPSTCEIGAGCRILPALGSIQFPRSRRCGSR